VIQVLPLNFPRASFKIAVQAKMWLEILAKPSKWCGVDSLSSRMNLKLSKLVVVDDSKWEHVAFYRHFCDFLALFRMPKVFHGKSECLCFYNHLHHCGIVGCLMLWFLFLFKFSCLETGYLACFNSIQFGNFNTGFLFWPHNQIANMTKLFRFVGLL